jgi:hypothetical protein
MDEEHASNGAYYDIGALRPVRDKRGDQHLVEGFQPDHPWPKATARRPDVRRPTWRCIRGSIDWPPNGRSATLVCGVSGKIRAEWRSRRH